MPQRPSCASRRMATRTISANRAVLQAWKAIFPDLRPPQCSPHPRDINGDPDFCHKSVCTPSKRGALGPPSAPGQPRSWLGLLEQCTLKGNFPLKMLFSVLSPRLSCPALTSSCTQHKGHEDTPHVPAAPDELLCFNQEPYAAGEQRVRMHPAPENTPGDRNHPTAHPARGGTSQQPTRIGPQERDGDTAAARRCGAHRSEPGTAAPQKVGQPHLGRGPLVGPPGRGQVPAAGTP